MSCYSTFFDYPKFQTGFLPPLLLPGTLRRITKIVRMESASIRYNALHTGNVERSVGKGLTFRCMVVFMSHVCCMIAGVALGISLPSTYTAEKARNYNECAVQRYSKTPSMPWALKMTERVSASVERFKLRR